MVHAASVARAEEEQAQAKAEREAALAKQLEVVRRKLGNPFPSDPPAQAESGVQEEKRRKNLHEMEAADAAQASQDHPMRKGPRPPGSGAAEFLGLENVTKRGHSRGRHRKGKGKPGAAGILEGLGMELRVGERGRAPSAPPELGNGRPHVEEQLRLPPLAAAE